MSVPSGSGRRKLWRVQFIAYNPYRFGAHEIDAGRVVTFSVAWEDIR